MPGDLLEQDLRNRVGSDFLMRRHFKMAGTYLALFTGYGTRSVPTIWNHRIRNREVVCAATSRRAIARGIRLWGLFGANVSSGDAGCACRGSRVYGTKGSSLTLRVGSERGNRTLDKTRRGLSWLSVVESDVLRRAFLAHLKVLSMDTFAL